MLATIDNPTAIDEELEAVHGVEISLDADVTAGEPITAVARCNDGVGTFVGLFFSDDLLDIAQAKAICRECPLREPCLAGATARREPAGVWGGELFQDGKVIAFKRKRGRPPKQPRPEELAAASGIPLPVAGA